MGMVIDIPSDQIVSWSAAKVPMEPDAVLRSTLAPGETLDARAWVVTFGGKTYHFLDTTGKTLEQGCEAMDMDTGEIVILRGKL